MDAVFQKLRENLKKTARLVYNEKPLERKLKMFCTNCGAPIEPGQKFCDKCGTPVNREDINVNDITSQPQPQMQTQPQPQRQPQYQSPVPPQPGKKKTWLIILIILAVLAAVSVIGGILAYRGYKAVRDYMIETGRADVPDIDSPEDYDDFYDDQDDLWDEYLDDIFDDALDQNFDFDDDTYDYDTFDEDYDFDDDALSYEYADVYVDDDDVLIVPNETITDSTEIWNGKTLGGFCDYIDSDVFAGNSPMNRDLLYKLIAIHMIDPQLVPDDDTFEIVMKYCLPVAAEFRDSGAVMLEAMFTTDSPNRYYYEMEVDGRTSTWMIDYDAEEVILNDGKTEYSSAGDYGMFTDKSMAIWMYAISDYFGLE